MFVVLDYGNNIVCKMWERKKSWVKGEGDTWVWEKFLKTSFLISVVYQADLTVGKLKKGEMDGACSKTEKGKKNMQNLVEDLMEIKTSFDIST